MVGFGIERYADPKRKCWVRKRAGQKSGTDAPAAVSDPNANYGITTQRPANTMFGADPGFRASQTRPRASMMSRGLGEGTFLPRPSMGPTGQGSRRESMAAMVSSATPGKGSYERASQGSRRPSMAPAARNSMSRHSGGVPAPPLSRGSRRESVGGGRPSASRAPGPRASGDPRAGHTIYETPVDSGSRR